VATGSVTTASLIAVPAGPATVLLANSGTASPVYVGAGTNVSVAGGFPVPSGALSPVVVPIYAGAPAGTWSCITASGTATLAWIVSSPSGGTGF
jgi:hypothetical protein